MSENLEQGERPAGPAGVIGRLCEALTQICLAIAGASLLCIVVINGANVIGRYVFLKPFSWAEELMLFLMVLSVFSAGIAITWRNMHIRIESLVERTSPLTQMIIQVFAVGVAVAVILTIVIESYGVVARLYRFDFRTDALSAPMWIPQSFVTIGLTLMAIMMVLRLIISFIAWRSRTGAASIKSDQ
jgi:TRAP-type C4-dicarboxylate transport system permease small subunit